MIALKSILAGQRVISVDAIGNNYNVSKDNHSSFISPSTRNLSAELHPSKVVEVKLGHIDSPPACWASAMSLSLLRQDLCFEVEVLTSTEPKKLSVVWPRHACGFVENFFQHRDYTSSPQTSLQPIPSPPAPSAPPRAFDGVPDLVPIPCKPCDQDRKDRQFIRGSPFTSSMTKLLVDYASGPSGGKLLASSPGMRGASDILHTDDNRYLLTPCANKVWLTIRLGDEIFLERIGIVSSELFASTFRHIQVLGSRQYPTNEWRVLGEIETNPVETHEWFDLSGSSQCSKCYVKFLKIRVLTHHALEGYTHCALTRIQVFGSTVLQSLDRIQNMNSSITEGGTSSSQVPAFIKLGSRGTALMETRFRAVMGIEGSGHFPDDGSGNSSSTVASPPLPGTPKPVEEGSNPLLNLIEEMNQLKKQYSSVIHSVYSMNEQIKAQAHSSENFKTGGSESNTTSRSISDVGGPSMTISIMGVSFSVPKTVFPEKVSLIIAALVFMQIFTLIVLFWKPANQSSTISHIPSNLVVSLSEDSRPVASAARRFSIRSLPPQGIQFKKRSHGLWRPKARRQLYAAMLKKTSPHSSSASSGLGEITPEPTASPVL
jgi:hypothetical protein